MKYLKLFEEYSIIQQPFFLIGDTLFISDEIAHRMVPTEEIDKSNLGWSKYKQKQIKCFFDNIKDENGYNVNRVGTNMSVGWGLMYKMDLSIYRANVRDNEFGHFEYYVTGISGTHEMHGKNMLRATRECNLNLIKKLYPIVGNIKSFYKRLKNKESFFDIIKNELIRNPGIAKDGIPIELEEEFGHISAAYKYNL
jgi:hypothetical protein